MKTKKDKVVDSMFLFLLGVVIVGLIIDIYIGKNATKPEAQPTQAPTTAETTEYIIEQEPTEQTDTEPTKTLYDVPLDEALQIHIIEIASLYDIDPAIVIAMAYKESSYNANCIGDNGNSYGLLQIQPKWHYDRMVKLSCTDLMNPYENVVVGIDYLAEQIDRYDDLAKGLTAYNRGRYSGTVTNYAKTIIAMAEELKGEAYVQ